LAIVLADGNQTEPALEQFRQAIHLLEDLEKKYPQEQAFLRDQVIQHGNLGAFLTAIPRDEEAAASWRRIDALRKKLNQEAPADVGSKSNLAAFWHNFGDDLVMKRKLDEARKAYQEAIRLERLALSMAPKQPYYRSRTCDHSLSLASAAEAARDHAAAAQAVSDAVADAPANWAAYPVAAALMARCAFLADRDDALPDDKRKALVQTYGDQAVALLRKAKDHGFKDADAVRKATQFDSIKGRKDFKALLEEIGKKR
jgi:hypothetical protein